MQYILEETIKLIEKSEGELIEKIREIVSSLGEERVSDEDGKSFKLKYKGIDISYRIDWGGRQSISIWQQDELGEEQSVFISHNPNKKDSPLESEVKTDEWESRLNYDPELFFSWKERFDDMYFIVKTLKKKYNIK